MSSAGLCRIRPLIATCALALAVIAGCGDVDPAPESNGTPTVPPVERTGTPAPTATASSTPVLEASTEQVDFGAVCALECEATATVELTGAVGAVQIEDDGLAALEDERVFSATSDCAGATLHPDRGDSCTLSLRFHPNTRGSFVTRIRVRHSGSVTPLAITLRGAGRCAEDVPADRLALLDERVGFGRHSSGGAKGCLYRVQNANDAGPGSLRYGAEAGGQWIVFDQDLTIRLESNIKLAGNTTIDGRGRAVVIEGHGLYMEGAEASNVILENLRIQHAGGGADSDTDLLRVWLGASDFWFDHLTLADASDEYIDIGHTEDGRTMPVFGTISWVRFDPGGPLNDDEKAVIIGSPAGAETNGLLHVTLHHNWFNGTRQRHPLASGAFVHSFNNVIRWRLWGIQARRDRGADDGSVVLSEHDVFDAAEASDGKHRGVRIVRNDNHVRVVEPMLLNGARVRESNEDSVPHPSEFYAYELDPVEDVVARVTAGAGAR